MHLKEAESKLINQIWAYIALVVILWLGVGGFILYQLRPVFTPPPAIPVTSTLPVIDTARVSQLEADLNARAAQTLPAAPVESYRPEPFD